MVDDLKRVLVSGASGYLGSHVIARLHEFGVDYVSTSSSGGTGEICDLTDPQATKALLARVRPDVVLHCAARVPKAAAGYDDAQFADDNVAMVENLCATGSHRIVLASSMTVYETPAVAPVEEDSARIPAAAYARGKWRAEQLLMVRGCIGDVALRLPGLFGLPRRSGVLYNATRAFLTGQPFELQSQSVLWAAMCVDDAADYMVRAARSAACTAPEVVNVGYRGEFSLPDVLVTLARLCGVSWLRPGAQAPVFAASLDRLEHRLGLLPATFGERLGEFVEMLKREVMSAENVDQLK
jgi:nucleoside-diphosphate-sugar epimerase